MEKNNPSFKLQLNSVTMDVQELSTGVLKSFRIIFDSKRKPIVIAKAMKEGGDYFWTSIPEGRQKEAEGLGKLIDEYFKTKDN